MLPASLYQGMMTRYLLLDSFIFLYWERVLNKSTNYFSQLLDYQVVFSPKFWISIRFAEP